ncbi:MAG: Rrf2 family transcriptional regulator [Spirochaetales bacterium]|nr:Rrf2 family transcriptional regulator [Spirochaetales bacterium]
MKISYKGDYAVKSLLFLASRYQEEGEQYFQLGEIAQKQDIPEKFLEQIFLLLRKAGYLKSHRGMNGGFALNRPPENIHLGDIVRLIDGPIAPIACVSTEAYQHCDFESKCVLKPLWAEVREAISSVVDHITFRDLVDREHQFLRQQAEHVMYYI